MIQAETTRALYALHQDFMKHQAKTPLGIFFKGFLDNFAQDIKSMFNKKLNERQLTHLSYDIFSLDGLKKLVKDINSIHRRRDRVLKNFLSVYDQREEEINKMILDDSQILFMPTALDNALREDSLKGFLSAYKDREEEIKEIIFNSDLDTKIKSDLENALKKSIDGMIYKLFFHNDRGIVFVKSSLFDLLELKEDKDKRKIISEYKKHIALCEGFLVSLCAQYPGESILLHIKKYFDTKKDKLFSQIPEKYKKTAISPASIVDFCSLSTGQLSPLSAGQFSPLSTRQLSPCLSEGSFLPVLPVIIGNKKDAGTFSLEVQPKRPEAPKPSFVRRPRPSHSQPEAPNHSFSRPRPSHSQQESPSHSFSRPRPRPSQGPQ